MTKMAPELRSDSRSGDTGDSAPGTAAVSRPVGLVTGSQPLRRPSHQPGRGRAALASTAWWWTGITVITQSTPVSFARLPELLPASSASTDPPSMLALGLALGTPVVKVEAMALNAAHFAVPDSEGARPRGGSASPSDGARRAGRDLGCGGDRRAQSWRRTCRPRVSFHAGTHLCNLTLFTYLAALKAAGSRSPCGFLHLPYLPEQVTWLMRRQRRSRRRRQRQSRPAEHGARNPGRRREGGDRRAGCARPTPSPSVARTAHHGRRHPARRPTKSRRASRSQRFRSSISARSSRARRRSARRVANADRRGLRGGRLLLPRQSWRAAGPDRPDVRGLEVVPRPAVRQADGLGGDARALAGLRALEARGGGRHGGRSDRDLPLHARPSNRTIPTSSPASRSICPTAGRPDLPDFKPTVADYFASPDGPVGAPPRRLRDGARTAGGPFGALLPASSVQLSLLHYRPPASLREEDIEIGAGEHRDTGAFTLLMQDDTGGLEVQRKDGEWIGARRSRAPMSSTSAT